ncbi:homeobox-leucine zipper protein HOX11-like [Asparagus officinalis]|uniref:homeobox-leucine zipper protein HOX11-like n=1 Tax=Asparagus officinalis TaxID=4686 RepID=UPI00098E381A|nr:homeobox-leucine zipper protein HOX11-like [Asparagus officinalis]
MGEDLQGNIGLGLGIGEVFASCQQSNKPPVQLNLFFPSWTKEEDEGDKGLITTKEGEKYAIIPRFRKTNEDDGGVRKKLRLTKEQSTILEESFKIHNTLNQNQKQTLAERLNLRPRQVEVWFQNRRARTKLKQTEVECEVLKKCCQSLSDENRRLKKELQELRSSKSTGSSVYVQIPKTTTIRMCPSCESISLNDETKNSSHGQPQVLRLCQ